VTVPESRPPIWRMVGAGMCHIVCVRADFDLSGRLHSSGVDGPIKRRVWSDIGTSANPWFSQANHILSQLPTPPKHEDYCKYNACLRRDGPQFRTTVLIYQIDHFLSFSGGMRPSYPRHNSLHFQTPSIPVPSQSHFFEALTRNG
jgi:hypothetical protein